MISLCACILMCFFSFLQLLELARGVIYVFVLHRHELFGNIFVRVDETNKLADVNVVMFCQRLFLSFYQEALQQSQPTSSSQQHE